MVLFFVDKKWPRKKKDTSRNITWRSVPLATTLAFQNGRLTITNNHAYKMYLYCLVVNHPEIALTFEKCIIQGKIIVCFTWTESSFHELCDFSWYLQVIARRFYESNEGEPTDGNLK